MRDLWKAHSLFDQFAWLAANRGTNNAFKMAALVGAINLSRFDVANESYLSESHRIN